MEGAEHEDVPDLDRRLDAERAAALRAGVAVLRLPDVDEGWVVVAAGLDAAEVPSVLVGACDVLALPECLVRDHVDLDADRPEGASARPEGVANLLVRRGPEGRLEEGLELLRTEPVVAADEREHEPVARDDRERLRGR